ncbi:histidine phosphatase superfamily [Bisporella sp. PMI_857]|nr:histidine phosphatase superfamily [Bisporella sp. PMI_857]
MAASYLIHYAASLLVLCSTVAAQSNDQITWGTFIFTYHGERRPVIANNGENLTPLGAQQLLSAGRDFRNLYINPPVNGSQITTTAPINGMNINPIDNSQILILSTPWDYVTASTQAFMQGLYPPRDALIVDEESMLSNASLVQYPLDGYQYPQILAVTPLDYNYISLSGSRDCSAYSQAFQEIINSDMYAAEAARTQNFYDRLATSVFADLASTSVTFYNAYQLYDYALYQYNHNATIFRSLSAGDLAQLHSLASQQQFLLNTPNWLGTISAISGATLAARVVDELAAVVDTRGQYQKMSLLFGSFQPFLAFFALSNLSNGPAASRFSYLPRHGSSMVFELFSSKSDQNSTFPSTENLWVRFQFRNGSSDTDPLIAYPLFGRPNSETDMTWRDFVDGMGTFSMTNLSSWCNVCQGVTLYCQALRSAQASSGSTSNSGSGSKKGGISPAVAGVIGAAVTIAVFILAGAILAMLGCRLGKRDKADGSGIGVLRRTGSGGGFKGAEKLASDTDLRLKAAATTGAAPVKKERVGSWELNESPTGAKHTSLDKELESGRSTAHYGRPSEDGLGDANPFSDPVLPRESV